VLVGGADEQDLVADLPAISSVDVGRQKRPGQIPEMLNSVDVRQRARDEYLRHRILLGISGGGTSDLAK
jgi:hypothetical protein